VKQEGKLVTWSSAWNIWRLRVQNFMRVVGDLVSVHNCSRNFNRTHKVEKVVAQAVGELLNVLLVHLGVV
jgi:hypothetical protein